MEEESQNRIRTLIDQASAALDRNDTEAAQRIIKGLEDEVARLPDSNYATSVRANLGGLLIDLGQWTNDLGMVGRGTAHASSALGALPPDLLTIAHYYNAANGHLAIWQSEARRMRAAGRMSPSLKQALRLFRNGRALHGHGSQGTDRLQMSQLLVNYGNCLDEAGRSVEGVALYDRALVANPGMGQALGNKAMTLHYLAPLARGHEHAFLRVAEELYRKALESPLEERPRQRFEKGQAGLRTLLQGHPGAPRKPPEQSPALSEFVAFHNEFCIQRQLFLTPAILLGADAPSPGDPMFVSAMWAPIKDDTKFDRVTTQLNQIKGEYVLARLLLVQANWKSKDIDSIDEAVALYYPLDYSVHGTYVHLAKGAVKLATDVLDKVSVFVRSYFELNDPAVDKTTFRNIWSVANTPDDLREGLKGHDNPFLYALFSLASDLKPEGDYGYIYDLRNALTHRFLVVQDTAPPDGGTKELPRIGIKRLMDEAVFAVQLSRCAVMYLIMMVDAQERMENKNTRAGIIPGVPVDTGFRWRPLG